MSFDETVQYLYGLQSRGIKFGLSNIRRLLGALGDPHESFRSVHVAGTNGKGSTAAMAEAILGAAGPGTGLFTSPHLVSLTERIRVNGVEITEEEVVRLSALVRAEAEKLDALSLTFFEAVTAMAYLHFRDGRVGWAVVETGLGGRLDSTNTLTPDVSVITRLGMDHADFLGNTLSEVAAEKAGIIKENVPLVTLDQKHEAMDAIMKKRAEAEGPVFVLGKDFSYEVKEESAQGVRFDYKGVGDFIIKDLFVPLAGRHQAENAALAIKAAELALKSNKGRPDEDGFSTAVREGLGRLKWPGRLEKLAEGPDIYIDGAHNPQAARALAATVKKTLLANGGKLVLIMGIMADKDAGGIMSPLIGLSRAVVFTRAGFGRSASPEALARAARLLGRGAETAATVPEAIEKARSLARNEDVILVTGSFYTAGEARAYLTGSKAALSVPDPWFPWRGADDGRGGGQ